MSKLNFFERLLLPFVYEHVIVGKLNDLPLLTYYKRVNSKRHVTRRVCWKTDKWVKV